MLCSASLVIPDSGLFSSCGLGFSMDFEGFHRRLMDLVFVSRLVRGFRRTGNEMNHC